MFFKNVLKITIVLFALSMILPFVSLVPIAHAQSSTMVINEICYDNPSGADGENYEWIELYNVSNQTIDLANWMLTDLDDGASGRGASYTHDHVFVMPPVSVPAGGYVVIVTGSRGTGEDPDGRYGNDYTFDFAGGDFAATLYWGRTVAAFSDAGDEIVLLEPDTSVNPVYDNTGNIIHGTIVDAVSVEGGESSLGTNNDLIIDSNNDGDGDDAGEFPGLHTDFTHAEEAIAGTAAELNTLALHQNGQDQDGGSSWTEEAGGDITRGDANDSNVGPQTNTIYENKTGLVINEFVYNQQGGDEWLNEVDEVVEIHNPTSKYIDMSNWALTDLANATSGGNHDVYDYNYHDHVFVFPGIIVPPGGYVTVSTGSEFPLSDFSFSGDNRVEFFWGRDRCVWNDAGDEVVLLRPLDSVIPTYMESEDRIRGVVVDGVEYRGGGDDNDLIIDSNNDGDGDDAGEHAVGADFVSTRSININPTAASDLESYALHHNGEDENTDSIWALETSLTYSATGPRTLTRPVSSESVTFHGTGVSLGSYNDEPYSDIYIQKTASNETTGDDSQYSPGDTIRYTMSLTNAGTKTSGVSLTDEIPNGTTYVSSSATSGTVNFNGNQIEWSGSVPTAGSIEVYLLVEIDENIENGATVANQAEIIFDFTGSGISDYSRLSDDPGTSAANDATLVLIGEMAETGGIQILIFVLAGLVLVGVVVGINFKSKTCYQK